MMSSFTDAEIDAMTLAQLKVELRAVGVNTPE